MAPKIVSLPVVRTPEEAAFDVAVQQMNLSARLAKSKRQGSPEAFKHQLDVLRMSMMANEVKYGDFKGGKA